MTNREAVTSIDPRLVSSKGLPWEGKAATALVFMVVANELLPVVFGAGAQAVWDWSFVYVTLRAVVIPGVSLVVLVLAMAGLFRSPGPGSWTRIVAILACGGAIYASWGYQLSLHAR